jgi:hypothetical protein
MHFLPKIPLEETFESLKFVKMTQVNISRKPNELRQMIDCQLCTRVFWVGENGAVWNMRQIEIFNFVLRKSDFYRFILRPYIEMHAKWCHKIDFFSIGNWFVYLLLSIKFTTSNQIFSTSIKRTLIRNYCTTIRNSNLFKNCFKLAAIRTKILNSK